jgi:uncharacterized membrane protein YoaK (UPF0700 family)
MRVALQKQAHGPESMAKCPQTTLHHQKIMESSSQKSSASKDNQNAEKGALSAWAGLIGAVAGALIGVFFGKAIVLGIALGVIGWLVGAFIDRSRM